MKHRVAALAAVVSLGAGVAAWAQAPVAAAPAAPAAGGYASFKVAIYIPAAQVQQLATLESRFDAVQRRVHADKVYIESHRGGLLVDGATLERAKAFFASRGVRTVGGITWTRAPGQRFQTFCYSDPADRARVAQVAAETARHFDEIILDDFFFTSCKDEGEIRARGDRSWTRYRLQLMREVARDLVVGAARKANPRVRVIIKFPNWYEHFQALGFDLEQEPYIFDGVYTGDETRDPVLNAQHLQAYNGYSVFRYFDNLRPGHDLGGWVDPLGLPPYLDRYAEQLWLTLFAKAPEITLFDFGLLQGPIGPRLRGAWQGRGLGTSFDYDAMMKASGAGAGNGTAAAAPDFALAAGYALRRVDKVVGALGKPLGVAVYRPYAATGEDFLPSFLGMVGIPIELQPKFPRGAGTVLLTQDAAADPRIVQEIERQVRAGGSVIITSGLLKALEPRGIGRIAELEYTGRSALVREFAAGTLFAATTPVSIPEPMIVPQVQYMTNDTWELASAIAGDNGFPLLTDSQYGKGHLYVLMVPDNFADLYRLPAPVLDVLRATASRGLPVRLAGAPSKVSLFEYDNGSFIVESFRDEPVTVQVVLGAHVQGLTNIDTGAALQPSAPPAQGRTPPGSRFTIQVPPHSFEAFAAR